MDTYTPNNVLTIADYEKHIENSNWNETSLWEPLKNMGFKDFIYSFGDYMLGRGLTFFNDCTQILNETEMKTCKEYYKIARELNLTHFQFDSFFIGFQYQPDEETLKRYKKMEKAIIKRMKERFSIETEINKPHELWKCLRELEALEN